MGAGASRSPGGDSATVVTSQRVRTGHVDAYKRWQAKTNEVASTFEGFEGEELYPPASGQENEWVEVFRFSHVHQLTAWLDSDARQRLLDEAGPLFEGPPAQEVLTGGTPAAQEAVTTVVSHEVPPGRERDFEHWQDKVLKAQERFPGFMGSELFKPVHGVQDRWVVAFRFDTRAHLEEWLASDARRKLLDEGRDYFTTYDVRKIGSSFGGWFRFGEGAQQEVPPNWKQAMLVLLALYPTVIVLNLTLGRGLTHLGVAAYLGLFISNICSVAILTWVLMPLVNRGLAFWLLPERAGSPRVHLAGVALVVACYVVLLIVFALTL
jgi:uncharacterized protein